MLSTNFLFLYTSADGHPAQQQKNVWVDKDTAEEM